VSLEENLVLRHPALNINLSEEEKRLVRAACELRGTKMMPWAREVVLDAARKALAMADRKPIVFERATDLMAMWLARFRVGDPCADETPTDNERLTAGHLAGALWGNDLLNTDGEKLVTVSSETDLIT